ncbi:aromatic amino acid hydroxylase [candidate division GN15 bacterium]|nr:aromatic amino acid hydroxylase [candidate division GN15 bacterium]
MADSTKSTSASLAGLATSNPQVARLPRHLCQFAVDQLYDQYTPIDHAVWRYIMRQNVSFLKKYAHRVYFTGLINTGISIELIPSIGEMNDILGKIGWGAVAVDGFIPPAAFMEFQAYKVLVIACDMRQIHHIEYTPAPDIVHEAAGHAPIIVDREYADYLRRFGEIGAKAMSSKKDFELYSAIRHLSILKERPGTPETEIKEAEDQVNWLQNNLGKPSEMALLSRLHWWTVEYGLIGDMENPKIYGAGLLSSIGESISCLDSAVKKIPYTIDAQDYAFDITTKQPQLFVTPDFEHLNTVLEEFASRMAFTRGGSEGLGKAIECENVSTAEYSSGLQVTGVFTDAPSRNGDQPYYLKAAGPSALAYGNVKLPGHGKDYHQDGFGSPVGRLKGVDQPLESLEDSQLEDLGIRTGQPVRLEFESGVTVEGALEKTERRDGKLLLMTFSGCTAKDGDTTLFDPSWGTYDMAVGQKIVSVFNGAADKDAYQDVSLVPKERTIKVEFDDKDRELHALYQRVRDIRNTNTGLDDLEGIFKKLKREFKKDWLLALEIVEILMKTGHDKKLELRIYDYLSEKTKENRDMHHLINQGFGLIKDDIAKTKAS